MCNCAGVIGFLFFSENSLHRLHTSSRIFSFVVADPLMDNLRFYVIFNSFFLSYQNDGLFYNKKLCALKSCFYSLLHFLFFSLFVCSFVYISFRLHLSTSISKKMSKNFFCETSVVWAELQLYYLHISTKMKYIEK